MDLKLDRVNEENRGEITKPTLVLCEGKRDASFILHLTANRQINGIQVGYPDEVTSNTTGNSGYREYLEKLRARTGFMGILRRVVILRDRNGSADTAFQDVAEQVRATAKYEVPQALEQETGGAPSIVVRLIPDTQTEGNLDVLLLSAIEATHPLNHCFDSYFACCNLSGMPVGKAAKIKLTTIVAASCQGNPSASLAFVWAERGNPIPLNSPKFNDVADFLRHFV